MNTLADQLKKEIKEREGKLSLVEQIPDLQEKTNRWKRKYLLAESVNGECVDFETKRSCGCCNDALFQVSFYTDKYGTRIYGAPVEIAVGECCPSSYTKIPYWDAVDKLEEKGFPPEVVAKLRSYLELQEEKQDDD